MASDSNDGEASSWHAAEFHAKIGALYRLKEANARAFFEEQTVLIGELEKEPHGGRFGQSLLKRARTREDQMRKSTANLPRKIGYHAAMARKYEHAAGYPWLPVEPDPPEPE